MFFYGACFLYRCLAAMEQRSVNRMNVRLLRPEDAKKHFNLRLKSLQESPMYFVKSYEEKKSNRLLRMKRDLKIQNIVLHLVPLTVKN